MSLLPTSRQEDFAIDHLNSCDSNMKEINNSNQLNQSDLVSASSSKKPNEAETKNYCNRINPKVKLLVRSHAMRESTSPPREPQITNSLATLPVNLQLLEAESINNTNITISDSSSNPILPIKQFSVSNNLIPNTNINNDKQQKLNNNNEPIYNNNLSMSQSSKQIKNSVILPTPSASSSHSQMYQKNFSSLINNKSENQKIKQNNLNAISKCSNCIKSSHYDRLVFIQTSKNQKNEQRRPNTLNICNNKCLIQCSNGLSNNHSNSKNKLKYQNLSSQGSYDSSLHFLSEDNNTELYTDSTGINLEQFIAETINRNQKDRTVLLKIEKDLIEFIKDKQKISHKFPNMSSYNRMLVHRVAAYFGMEHNVDQSGLSVIVTRTKNMRIPDMRFKEHIRDDILLTEEPRRSILKRDSNSFEDTFNFKSPDRILGGYCRRSKSFEEREEEYERARRRIFEDSSSESNEVSSWPYWSSSESSKTSAKYRLLHPSNHFVRQTKLLKGESLDDRNSFHSNSLRPSVSKSFSFGGYTKGMLSRDNSVISTYNANGYLMQQHSGASMCSHLSPSSSGHKSQSQRNNTTISATPSASSISNMIYNQSSISGEDRIFPESNSQTVMWAVTSISSVPPGSVIINPQTNQPYINSDGSLYRFDPDNPPKFFIDNEENESVSMWSKHAESKSQETDLNSTNVNKRQRFQAKKSNNYSSFAITSTIITTMTTTTTVTSATHLTNPKISNVTLTPSSTPLSPSPLPILYQYQHQCQPQFQLQLQRECQQQSHQCLVQQRQPLIKTITMQPFNHNLAAQPYLTYGATSEPYRSIYQHDVMQQTMMTPHYVHKQSNLMNSGQEDIYNHNSVFASYTLPAQHMPVPQSGDLTDLSHYFMGMNVYNQRDTGDNQITSSYPYSSHHTLETNQILANVQPIQHFWQTSANQMVTQQTMHFIPSSGLISLNQNSGDRQELAQQQRFNSRYSINLQTVAPSSHSNGATNN